MNDNLLKKDIKSTLDEVGYLKNAIHDFSLIVQNDPALGHIGKDCPFTGELMEFRSRAQELLKRLHGVPEMLTGLKESDTGISDSAAKLLDLATEVRTELEWLENMQLQLNGVMDASLHDFYELLMFELSEAVAAVVAEIKAYLQPLLKSALEQLYRSEPVNNWLTTGREWFRQMKEANGLYAH